MILKEVYMKGSLYMNKATKKLTNASGAVCVFALLSFVFAAIGAAFDPIATLIHNAVFKHDIDLMFIPSCNDTLSNVYYYILIYSSSIVLCIASLVIMILMFKNKGKKGLSSTTASIIIFTALAGITLPAVGMVERLKNSVMEIKSNYTDQTVFLRVCDFLVYCIPLISGFFLLLSGLCLALKLSGESFTVEIERVSDFQLPAEHGFGQMQEPAFNKEPFAAPVSNPEAVIPAAVPVIPTPAASQTESEPKCPHCGAVLKNPNAKFCSVCGQKTHD